MAVQTESIILTTKKKTGEFENVFDKDGKPVLDKKTGKQKTKPIYEISGYRDVNKPVLNIDTHWHEFLESQGVSKENAGIFIGEMFWAGVKVPLRAVNHKNDDGKKVGVDWVKFVNETLSKTRSKDEEVEFNSAVVSALKKMGSDVKTHVLSMLGDVESGKVTHQEILDYIFSQEN